MIYLTIYPQPFCVSLQGIFCVHRIIKKSKKKKKLGREGIDRQMEYFVCLCEISGLK
jgi:hypothetical protein